MILRGRECFVHKGPDGFSTILCRLALESDKVETQCTRAAKVARKMDGEAAYSLELCISRRVFKHHAWTNIRKRPFLLYVCEESAHA